MLLSLPPTLLVWAILLFAVSIISYALQNVSSSNLGDRSAAWLILGVFLLVLAAIAVAIYTLGIIWKFQSRNPMRAVFTWRRRDTTTKEVT
jgi:hypothetical protein